MSETAVKLFMAPGGADAPRRSGLLRRDRILVAVALFAGAGLISGFTILQGIDPFDEGLTLAATRRMVSGQVPYRDFLWAYGPAQPYLLALLWKLFGASLLQWRILRVLADAAVSLVAFALVRRRAPPLLAVAVWLAVAGEMAEPRSANPFPFALLGALLALALVTGDAPQRRVAPAALVTALAAAFRLDFALYGLAATTVALGLREGVRRALMYAGASVALILVVYAPFAVLDGPGRLYHALVGVSLSTRAYWTLPFPWVFHAPAGAGVGETIKHAIDFYVPALTVIGFGLGMFGTFAMVWFRRAERELPALECGLAVLALGCLSYLLSRTDEFHTQPLFVVVAILLGLVLARAAPHALSIAPPAPRAVLLVPAAVLTLLLVHSVANRISAAVRPPAMATLALPVADGVQAPPFEARSIERVVGLVDARVPTGRPIYVAPRRSDLVRLNDPLLYVLADRPNPTSQDFGLQAGAAAQRTIVNTLARVRPAVIVRWTDPASSQREPNLRGRPTGVHTLDDWIGVHYAVLARLYHYDVLVISRG